MNKPIKNPSGGMGSLKHAKYLCSSKLDKNITGQIQPPSKYEVSLMAFLKYESLNTLEANRIYGDTCLHSQVPIIRKKFGIDFRHEKESIKNRVGRNVPFTRYHLIDIEKAKLTVAILQRERGLKRV